MESVLRGIVYMMNMIVILVLIVMSIAAAATHIIVTALPGLLLRLAI